MLEGVESGKAHAGDRRWDLYGKRDATLQQKSRKQTKEFKSWSLVFSRIELFCSIFWRLL